MRIDDGRRAASSLLRRVAATSLLGAALVMLGGGCGRSSGDRVAVFPVEGAVTFDGKPLADALVALHPKNPAEHKAPTAQGRTDAQGKFRLTTYESNDGAAAGEYKVTVQYFPLQQNGESYSPGPNALAPKLAVPDQSDIVVKVAEGPNQLDPIEVRR